MVRRVLKTRWWEYRWYVSPNDLIAGEGVRITIESAIIERKKCTFPMFIRERYDQTVLIY